MDFLRELKLSLQVRLSLIVLIVMALVLAGIGLMEYFKVYQTDSDPRAAKMFIALLVFGLLMIIFLMFRARMTWYLIIMVLTPGTDPSILKFRTHTPRISLTCCSGGSR